MRGKCDVPTTHQFARLAPSEALPVDDFRAEFVVFLHGDAHVWERGEFRKHGTSGPDGVLPVRGGDNFDTPGVARVHKVRDFALEALR